MSQDFLSLLALTELDTEDKRMEPKITGLQIEWAQRFMGEIFKDPFSQTKFLAIFEASNTVLEKAKLDETVLLPLLEQVDARDYMENAKKLSFFTGCVMEYRRVWMTGYPIEDTSQPAPQS